MNRALKHLNKPVYSRLPTVLRAERTEEILVVMVTEGKQISYEFYFLFLHAS